MNISDSNGGTSDYYDSDGEVANRVPELFVSLSLCYFVLVSISAWCITVPNAEEEQAIAAASVGALVGAESADGDVRRSDGKGSSITYQAAGTIDDFDIEIEMSNRKGQTNVDESSSSRVKNKNDNNSAENPIHQNGGLSVGVTTSAAPLNPQIDSSSTSSITPPPSSASSSSAFYKEMGPKELLFTPLAWHLATCFVTTTVGGMFLAGTYKTYGAQIFRSETFLSSVGAISSVFNAVG